LTTAATETQRLEVPYKSASTDVTQFRTDYILDRHAYTVRQSLYDVKA
jgi:hypothetical protein